jgi:hypothetical protein
VLLQALGKQAGLNLTAEPAVGNEVMLVQAKDVTVADLMAKMADAAGGKWGTTTTGGYMLVRPSELIRSQENAEVQERQARLQTAFAPYLNALTDSSGTAGSSSNKVMARLVQSLGLDQLASTSLDSRIVYSTSPTRVQQALGSDAGQIVLDFVQEQRAAQQGSDAQAPSGARGRATPTMGSSGNLGLTPAKADLILTHPGSADVYDLELLVGDAEGRLVTRADMPLVLRPAAKDTADVRFDSGGDPLQLSALSLELSKLIRSSGAPVLSTMGAVVVRGDAAAPYGTDAGTAAPAGGDLRKALSSPETYEPLEFCAGEALGAAADALKMNVVAVLPDSCLLPATQTVAGGTLTAAGVVAAAQTDWGLKAAVDGSWLEFRPRKQASSYNYRLDRGVMGKTLRQLTTNGFLTLDDRATYAAGEPIAPAGGNFEGPLFRLFSPTEARGLEMGLQSGERKMLRFFASLTYMQRQALGAGRAVSVTSAFSGNDALFDMVYNSISGPSAGSGSGGAARTPTGPRRQPRVVGDLTSERTEVLPDGIPGGTELAVQASSRPSVFGIAENGEKVPTSGSVVTYAGGGASTSRFDSYVVGDRITYIFVFRFTPEVTLRKVLTDVNIDPNAKGVPYDQLPDDVRKQAEQSPTTVSGGQAQSAAPPRP